MYENVTWQSQEYTAFCVYTLPLMNIGATDMQAANNCLFTM